MIYMKHEHSIFCHVDSIILSYYYTNDFLLSYIINNLAKNSFDLFHIKKISVFLQLGNKTNIFVFLRENVADT